MPDAPRGAADQHDPVHLLALQLGVPIASGDFDRIAGMVQALWRSGGSIRYAFDNDVSVIPLTAVPDDFPRVGE